MAPPNRIFQRIAAKLPDRWQAEVKRVYYARQIKRGTFATEEPEHRILPGLINLGDWVIDVGAGVGHYTKQFSELVGARGRVIALEPVPNTFFLLCTNARLFAHPNVTLLNVAASDKFDVAGMSIPTLSTGLTNYYMARLRPARPDGFSVLTVPLDSLGFDHRIALVKIDSEDHESFVLAGMQRLLQRDHPVLIVETRSQDVITWLTSMGYGAERLEGSPNVVFKPIV